MVVLGAGPIGLLTGLMARHAGAAQVLISDPDPARLRIAAQLGLVPVDLRGEDPAARVMAATGGDGADMVFECAGVEATALEMTRIVRPGGTICLASLHETPNPVALLDIAFKEIRLIGSRVYTREQFRRSIDLAQTLATPLQSLISDILPLSAAKNVFGIIDNPGIDSVKILIDCTA